jgi:hypothetical protein
MASDEPIKGENKFIFHHHKDKLEEDVEKFEAKSFKTDVNFKKCDHSQAKFINGEIRCVCGAAWRGPNLAVLLENLTKKK